VVTEIDVSLPRSRPASNRTDEDTVDLLRRLATLYPDTIIAGILNRQDRTTGTGKRFTANDVGNLRRHRGIARFEPPAQAPRGELLSVIKAAATLGVSPPTLHRWLADGLVAGEQVTPGAPWQIRITDDLHARFVAETPPGYVPMIDATRLLGVSRQTVMQRIKRGEIDAVLVVRGLRKGLRIKIIDSTPDLFTESS
jgi:predicted DNA-binding transcriptional regulator AlpA